MKRSKSTPRLRATRAFTLATSAVLTAAMVTACSSSSDSGADAGSVADAKVEANSDTVDYVKKMATAAAEAAGPATTVKKQTVGILEIAHAAEVVARDTHAIKTAAKKLGWSVKTCDAGGVPSKYESCAQSLLTQGVTAIVAIAIPSETVSESLRDAKAKGVPWINVAGATNPNELIATQLVEDETALGTCMADYLVSKIGSKKAKLAYNTYPPVVAVAQRAEQFTKAVAANPNLSIASKFVSDEADPSKAGNWAQDILGKTPDLAGFFMANTPDIPYVANVLRSKYGNKSYPDKPLLVGLYGDLSTLELIRQGHVSATCEVPIGADGYMAIDQLAEYATRGTPFPSEGVEAYGIDFLAPFLVTKENAPKDAKFYATPKYDFETYFDTKWQKEFGV